MEFGEWEQNVFASVISAEDAAAVGRAWRSESKIVVVETPMWFQRRYVATVMAAQMRRGVIYVLCDDVQAVTLAAHACGYHTPANQRTSERAMRNYIRVVRRNEEDITKTAPPISEHVYVKQWGSFLRSRPADVVVVLINRERDEDGTTSFMQSVYASLAAVLTPQTRMLIVAPPTSNFSSRLPSEHTLVVPITPIPPPGK